MDRLLKIMGYIIAICILVGIPLISFFLLRYLWEEIKAMNSDLAIALITAATTILVSTATVMIGRHYERKKEIEAHFRATKIQMYDEFLKELFGLFQDGAEEKDLTPFLREWQRKLVLWAGPDVLKAYFAWKTKMKIDAQSAQSVFAMDLFFRALRKDVGQGSGGLEPGAFSHLILRHSELFLHHAKKNPKITLSELSKIEKEMGLE